MAFVSSLCQTKTKCMPECSSQRLCGLVVLSKFVITNIKINHSYSRSHQDSYRGLTTIQRTPTKKPCNHKFIDATLISIVYSFCHVRE